MEKYIFIVTVIITIATTMITFVEYVMYIKQLRKWESNIPIINQLRMILGLEVWIIFSLICVTMHWQESGTYLVMESLLISYCSLYSISWFIILECKLEGL